MTTVAIVLENLGGACLLASMALMYQEVGEANRKLPDDQQISYFWFHAEKVSRIRREYRRLYPHSSVDRYQVALGWLGLVLVLFGAAAPGFVKHWPFR
jgi:hypothetical protein